MIRSIVLTVTIAASLGGATQASAFITAFWQQNAITPQAIAADPTGVLASSQSWSLIVSITDGDFASASLRAVLPTGSTFYNTAPARGGGDTTPTQQAVSMFADVEFDTYVAAGIEGGQAIVVEGFPAGQPISFGGPTDPIPGTFSVSWGDLVNVGPATHEIARFTFPGTIGSGDVYIQNDLPGGKTNPGNSTTSQVAPEITIIIPSIPEPSALATSLGGLLLLIRRRQG